MDVKDGAQKSPKPKIAKILKYAKNIYPGDLDYLILIGNMLS